MMIWIWPSNEKKEYNDHKFALWFCNCIL